MQDLIWFVQDTKQLVLGGLGLIVFFIVIFSMLNYDPNKGIPSAENLEPNSPEQIAYMEENSAELKEVFSELQTMDIGYNAQYPVLDIALYLKQPFMPSTEIQAHIEMYMDLLKLRYNDEEEGTKLRAVIINVYDRKAVFEQGLEPNGTYRYMYSSENVKHPDEDDENFDTQGMSTVDLAWQQTIENEKEPDYDKYAETFTYNDITLNAGAKPMSDEEFEWFLKFDKYIALVGSVGGGADLYLQWDLGANTSEDGYVQVTQTFEEFVYRLDAINAKTSYYADNLYDLYEDLAIQNPQFLLFAEYEEIIDDPFDARARLIELNPDRYSEVIEAWIEEQAGNYSSESDPASADNPENKTNSQLQEMEELENQEEDILNQSSDAESTDESESTEETESTNESD